MKLFYIFISILLQNCSFDNKSGIWKNENEAEVKKKNPLSNFSKNLNLQTNTFIMKLKNKNPFYF